MLLGRDCRFDSERGSDLERCREADGHLQKGKMLDLVISNKLDNGQSIKVESMLI